MAIFNEDGKKYYDRKIKELKTFDLDVLKNSDRVIVKDVIEKIGTISVTKKKQQSTDIDINYLSRIFNLSLADISIFGYDITEMVEDLIRMISIKESKEGGWQNEILFPSANLRTLDYKCTPGSIIYPTKSNNCDEVFLGHEEIHLLKDTNPEEFLLCYTLIEVIPIFYELLMSEDIDYLSKDILSWRLSQLKESGKEILRLTNLKGIAPQSEKKYIDMAIMERSVYQLSFYYALILFNMYQTNPNRILYLVRCVLMHELTTLELLEELGIYNVRKSHHFDEGIEKVKTII